MSLHFDELFRKKLQKSASFREKTRKTIDLAKSFQLFEQTAMSWHFHELFSKKLQKVPHSVEKHEKSSIGPKLATFSNKVPCLCVSMNFSAKGCKKCLVSWKSTKNHRLGQNLQLFEQTTMFWHFDELFRKKMQKSGPFREKARTLIDLAKTCNFSKKLPCFGISMIVAGKSGSFREKWRKIIDLA